MKIRGTLKITKNLILPGPGGTVAAEGLIALSDENGSVRWARFSAPELDEAITYNRGNIIIHEDLLYFCKDNNVPGTLPLSSSWISLGEGTGGSDLTQAQLDAINNSNNPTSSNPFATLADVSNLTILGTKALDDILLEVAPNLNSVWLTSTAGLDSLGNAVAIGDGLIARNATTWETVGPMTGIKGDQGDPGVGTKIEGTDTLANILAKDVVAGENTLWLTSDSGVDDAGTPVVAGDGLVSDGAQWLTVGAIRGPVGDKGDPGDTGATGATAYAGTYLIKYSVEWIEGFRYLVTVEQYVISGDLYSASTTEVTLDSSDPVLNRTDIVVANILGQIYSKTGANSVTPTANEAYEVLVTYIDVPANAITDPNMVDNTVYNEGGVTEWTASVPSSGGASIDLAYTGDSFEGGQCIKVINGRNESIQFDAAVPVTIATEFGALVFKMKSLSVLSNAYISMWLFNGTDKVGISLDVAEFGYDYTNITDWQSIVMPVASFSTLGPTLDRILLNISDPTSSKKSDFLVDSIKYQFGVYAAPGNQPLEYTSQLINNGDGIYNFATLNDLNNAPASTLDEVTTEGNTSSNDVIVASDVNNTVTVKTDGSIEFQNSPTAILKLDGDHTSNVTIKLPKSSGVLALNTTSIHSQGTSEAVWDILHNMGKFPSVTVVNTSKTTIDAVVTYIDENNVTVSVNPASAGYAYLN